MLNIFMGSCMYFKIGKLDVNPVIGDEGISCRKTTFVEDTLNCAGVFLGLDTAALKRSERDDNNSVWLIPKPVQTELRTVTDSAFERQIIFKLGRKKNKSHFCDQSFRSDPVQFSGWCEHNQTLQANSVFHLQKKIFKC